MFFIIIAAIIITVKTHSHRCCPRQMRHRMKIINARQPNGSLYLRGLRSGNRGTEHEAQVSHVPVTVFLYNFQHFSWRKPGLKSVSTTVLVRACRELLHVHHKSVQLNTPWLCTRKALSRDTRVSIVIIDRLLAVIVSFIFSVIPHCRTCPNNYQTSIFLSECTFRPSVKGNEPTF